MASIVLTVTGAVVGSAIGGPVGGSIGAALGGSIGGYIDTQLFGQGSQSFTQEGTRLEDLRVQTSAFGREVADVWGDVRVAGNVIWAIDIIEEKRVEEETQDTGKGGGGSVTTTTVSYHYFATCAVGICAGPIGEVIRVWADTKVLYNLDSDDADTIEASKKVPMTVYRGTENQLPDPVIEGIEGVGNVPAYRGLAYVVFERLPLADYGNRIPNFGFLVRA